ncbi:root phototropism protein 2 [Ananas comosus]|uniref:Root phototropism protein 2 n=1 Tax=Ananas comosus TaxID=4615 RepID=A0A6P5G9W6_ANACO|nr:root phototropism protein 2 [Ananas comosus]
MAVASPNSHFSTAMERTGQWVFSQEVPADVVVEIGDSRFPLHKFLLVARSGYMRRRILEANPSEVVRVDLSGLPGGAEAFEKAAKFCYGVNFEITVHNVAALRCAAEYLEMTEEADPGGGSSSLARRAEEFLSQAALKTLPGAVAVLRSCEEGLLPWAEELRILQRCVDVIALKACNESNFPDASLASGGRPSSPPRHAPFQKVALRHALSHRGRLPAIPPRVAAYLTSSSLPRPPPGPAPAAAPPPSPGGARRHTLAGGLLESIRAPSSPRTAATPRSPVGFLCLLLRPRSPSPCHRLPPRAERRIAAKSLDSRIIADSFEHEAAAGAGAGGLLYGGGAALCSAAMQKVARTVDAFVSEIATDVDLSVSKFAGIAGALPKSSRHFDDDLYRAVDIYLKAHSDLDEIEREKVCSVMDPLRLSYEARLHAAQNKRLPLQIVLHALYYDQLKLRSSSASQPQAAAVPKQHGDASLTRENEALRSELARMRLYVSELERTNAPALAASKSSSATPGPPKKPTTFFASVSRKLGKLNPFRHGGAKDTSMLHDDAAAGGVDVTKPRRRRFSIS